ncbi:MAG TPA: hypothetical protein RMH99_23535 [Sandaracinaceae bacterium LLY-WYZ-13_1]|nr:hypothetical protein [Sandaracinaceae bacterium LLY-WYZ-13_1]
MRRWRIARAVRVVPVVCALLGGCEGSDAADGGTDAAAADASAVDAGPDGGGRPRPPSADLVTFNVGTTPFIDFLGRADYRADCRDWYDNNLCLQAAEDAVRDELAALEPRFILLQEMWFADGCTEADRPPRADEPPFVCALEGRPIERVLPAGFGHACATAHPDNCVGFDRDAFTVEDEAASCDGRDCAAALVGVDADCGGPSRSAILRGRTDDGPLALVVLHLNAGPTPEDQACRAAQLEALRLALDAEVDGGAALLIGGDFNFDPAVTDGPDTEAFEALVGDHGLSRLADDPAVETNRLLEADIDFFLARGLPGQEASECTQRFVDGHLDAPFFDHALVSCALE